MSVLWHLKQRLLHLQSAWKRKTLSCSQSSLCSLSTIRGDLQCLFWHENVNGISVVSNFSLKKLCSVLWPRSSLPELMDRTDNDLDLWQYKLLSLQRRKSNVAGVCLERGNMTETRKQEGAPDDNRSITVAKRSYHSLRTWSNPYTARFKRHKQFAWNKTLKVATLHCLFKPDSRPLPPISSKPAQKPAHTCL